jgi:hypothetical protein
MTDFLGRSAYSVTLTITDGEYFAGGKDQFYGYNQYQPYGALTPTTGSLWTGNIILLYATYDNSSGDGSTFIRFDTDQSYIGNYKINYGGVEVTLSRVDARNWSTTSQDLFVGDGVTRSVTISKV